MYCVAQAACESKTLWLSLTWKEATHVNGGLEGPTRKIEKTSIGPEV
jgi:hypothetical protein